MKNRNTLTLGSLFDGSGGFPLGGLIAGIEPRWSSEIEPFPILVTHKRLPQVKHYGDVSKLSGRGLEPVDIITFGSPCQDLSIAGKRAGIQEGERSNLFFQAVRIIKEMREATDGKYPIYCVWENVPGAFSSNGGEDFRAVLEAVTWNSINGKKPKTEAQVRRWLASPYTDAAEYKLWGNGISLPIVYFVMSGIAWAAGKEERQ